jgi:hypothetical protein
MTTVTIPISNLSRFIDFEKTIYVFIEATNLDGGAQLQLDQLNLVKPRT